MLLIPAIDLLNGRVVRLYKGDMDNAVVYSTDPVSVAKKFAAMGAKRLHIVDLDGARTGGSVNHKIIEEIVKLDIIKVEVGGGIRDISRLERYFSIGVEYAILGTVVAKNPVFTKKALEIYSNKIILGIDAKNGKVATDGWNEDSGIKVEELLNEYKGYSPESIIFTDIDQDGTLQGVNWTAVQKLADIAQCPIIASGGVASGVDIDKMIEINHPNIMGCIIGKAYYENKIDIAVELQKVRRLGL